MYAIYCKLRDEKKLKDAEVSRATGISKSTFSDWKHGKTNPKADKLKTLAEFFGVSVEYLMGTEKVENKKPTDNGELSEAKRELISFVNTLQEDAAESMLRMMKAYYEEWQRNQR